MCGGEFMNKDPQNAWEFLEDVANKSMQWETIGETQKPYPPRGGIYYVLTKWETDDKMATLIRRVEAVEL